MGTAKKTLIPEMRSTCSSDSIRDIQIVLTSVGLQDDVCPPRTSFATYNAVRSPKKFVFTRSQAMAFGENMAS